MLVVENFNGLELKRHQGIEEEKQSDEQGIEMLICELI